MEWSSQALIRSSESFIVFYCHETDDETCKEENKKLMENQFVVVLFPLSCLELQILSLYLSTVDQSEITTVE